MLRRSLLLILFLGSVLCWSSFAQSNENAAPSQQIVPPLTDDELREIVVRLFDLGSAWAEIDAERAARIQEEELAVKERAFHEQQLALEQQRRELVEKDRDVQRLRGDFFEGKAKSLEKKRGAGCWIAKILSLGLARC